MRFAADAGYAPPLVVPIAPALEKFGTTSYRSWEARFMPRQFCRFVVEIVEVQEEAGQAVLRVKLMESAK